MALPLGSRLGPYEVTAQIGVGGMGEVYRATDTNLKRAVAIKVLPASVAADAERLARFQREAEVLASLNHPNIAAIYGLERSGNMTALVMELVEGPTLADRIARQAIPIDEAIPIAKQIYVQPYPGLGSKRQISFGGATSLSGVVTGGSCSIAAGTASNSSRGTTPAGSPGGCAPTTMCPRTAGS
jgi:hypothetical protein